MKLDSLVRRGKNFLQFWTWSQSYCPRPNNPIDNWCKCCIVRRDFCQKTSAQWMNLLLKSLYVFLVAKRIENSPTLDCIQILFTLSNCESSDWWIFKGKYTPLRLPQPRGWMGRIVIDPKPANTRTPSLPPSSSTSKLPLGVLVLSLYSWLNWVVMLYIEPLWVDCRWWIRFTGCVWNIRTSSLSR